jgi:hypothetical protein
MPMPLQFTCPECHERLKAPNEAAGRSIQCPRCQATIQVPQTIYEAEPVSAAPGGGSAEEKPQSAAEVGTDPLVADDRRPCPMCGEMIKANAVKCRFCGEVFDPTLKRAGKKTTAPPGEYTEYEQVPWYRRSGTASLFALAGFFCFPPLLWIVCILCLTGDIYNKTYTKDGYLMKWSWANKIAAILILLLQSAGLVLRFSGVLSRR